MKKFITLLTLTYILCSSAIAQSGKDNEIKKLSFGIKAGLIYGHTITASNELNFDESPEISFSSGAYCSLKINRLLCIQPELVYTRLAYKINNLNYVDTNGNNLITGATSMRLHYLQLPIIAKITIPKTGLSIMPGIQFGYLLKATGKVDGYNQFNTGIYKKLDVNLALGFQYHFSSGIEIGVRKTIGILNIAKDRPGTIELPVASYLTIGYVF